MNLVLLGSPGAGKGTQAVRIAQSFELIHLSSGDILRTERKDGTNLGRKAQIYMDRGDLVPDDLILDMMMIHIKEPQSKSGFLLDGFPRTLAQARGLDLRLAEEGQRIDGVICLEVDDEEASRRLTGRSSCPKCGRIYHTASAPPATPGKCDDCGVDLTHRRDDSPEVVGQRLKTYHDQTKPLIAYYGEKGVLRKIAGVGNMDDVTVTIKKACQNI